MPADKQGLYVGVDGRSAEKEWMTTDKALTEYFLNFSEDPMDRATLLNIAALERANTDGDSNGDDDDSGAIENAKTKYQEAADGAEAEVNFLEQEQDQESRIFDSSAEYLRGTANGVNHLVSFPFKVCWFLDDRCPVCWFTAIRSN